MNMNRELNRIQRYINREILSSTDEIYMERHTSMLRRYLHCAQSENEIEAMEVYTSPRYIHYREQTGFVSLPTYAELCYVNDRDRFYLSYSSEERCLVLLSEALAWKNVQTVKIYDEIDDLKQQHRDELNAALGRWHSRKCDLEGQINDLKWQCQEMLLCRCHYQQQRQSTPQNTP